MQKTKTFFESTGLGLRKIANVIWLCYPLIILVLLTHFTTLFIPTPDIPPIEIVSENVEVIEYSKTNKKSTCRLEIYFNQRINWDEITVAFYDIDGNELETLNILRDSRTGYNLICEFFAVNGKVDSFKIIDYSTVRSAEYNIYYDEYESKIETVKEWISSRMLPRYIYAIPIVLSAMFFSCKTYRVGEHEIVVYAGRMKHYIKIDGRKYDEKNALISFSAITLNATLDSGENIEVYIPSFTKRISLRVNGVLETPIF